MLKVVGFDVFYKNITQNFSWTSSFLDYSVRGGAFQNFHNKNKLLRIQSKCSSIQEPFAVVRTTQTIL